MAEHWKRLPKELMESPSEDIQDAPELIPVSSALGDPALPDDFQRFLPTLTIL